MDFHAIRRVGSQLPEFLERLINEQRGRILISSVSAYLCETLLTGHFDEIRRFERWSCGQLPRSSESRSEDLLQNYDVLAMDMLKLTVKEAVAASDAYWKVMLEGHKMFETKVS